MKLRYSSTSPFVRKVMVTAHEAGIIDQIEPVATNVWAKDTDIGTDNPVGKVPTIVTDGGEILYDSSVICEYLDSLHDGKKLFPASGGARWQALRVFLAGGGPQVINEVRRPDDAAPFWFELRSWLRRLIHV